MQLKLIPILLTLFPIICNAQLLGELNSKKHFAAVYTQGLIINDNMVWESSGLYGQSMITQWDLDTGKVIKQKKLDKKYFAEGLTELNGKLFLLTWKAGVAFEIDKQTLEITDKHYYKGEGWGLTTDGKQLIMSNGTDSIQFLDPETFEVERIIRVHMDRVLIYKLNELEWIDGMIWANVYTTDYIVVIDPKTGSVSNKFYLPQLLGDKGKNSGVLNGIAYDKVTKKIWVTGKNWPLLFQM
jgi:glutamine cyclotransferase